ncbi:DUF6320 domain-containing protein [Butyricicoccus faecihominis]|uniref:DUF6320 domain-containing protein n=1 Tax=Butyricicoccaceae TaxID=3085642 RepID=UPI00247A967E|nr:MULTISPECIES: DUF6320 domain-containing protein [Butyricicoccaceae]MCQ5129391.1 DUF6320 domain-containing protein [Butyricicoccus faecihominis]WNX85155.1 DUF6320 domain-containing protein [Agathobaculum sp. NTUH-O15-33]
MQHCPYCKVNVAGHKTCCPLCGGQLAGEPEPDTEIFPDLPRRRLSGNFVLRVLALIAIVVSAISVLVNMAVSTRVWWSAFVAVGAACVWVAAAIGVQYRRDIMQNIMWQMFLIPGLSILWDLWTGWRGWSIDFVLPCVCMAALLTMLVLATALRLPVRTFAGGFSAACALGLVPFILVACGKVNIRLPSFLCAGLSIVLLAALFLFQWQTIKAELARRFHL